MSIVRSFFETRLKTFADANNIPIAFQGVGFTKPASGQWLEAIVIPNMSYQREITADAAKVSTVGIYQVNVWVKSGTGLGSAEALAQSIVALFPVVPKGTVSIEIPGHVGRALSPDNSGWIAIPVTFGYRYN